MRRHLGVFSCTMLMYAASRLISRDLLTCGQSWAHDWISYLLHAVLHSDLRAFRRGIFHGLDSRLCALVLRTPRLARVWNDVPAVGRREGVS